MTFPVVDPSVIYRDTVHMLGNSLRTSTYKLATMVALVDFSRRHRPAASDMLDVPLTELAQIVIALYWDHLKPFDGAVLRQSTLPQSRIFEAIASLRSAAALPDDAPTLEAAARFSPGVFQGAVHDVVVCLAQQPLPRLQRTAGAARSNAFLYDDSFLHDNVTRAQLAQHRNSIQLRPGVAHGLALYAEQLREVIQVMWVRDVLRLNRMGLHDEPRVRRHLFGEVLDRETPVTARMPARGALIPPGSRNSRAIGRSQFARRLNRLFEMAPAPNSSGEVAAMIRGTGYSMTVSTLMQLRTGTGSPPSEQTIAALAKHFGVDPTYFYQDAEDHDPHSTTDRPARSGDSEQTSALSTSSDPYTADDAAPAQVFDDDLEQIAAACDIRADGCWIRPSNTPVRCRYRDDLRRQIDLPKMGLSRWSWIVANGYAGIAIPSYLIRIRRTCGSWTCCNPQHLFATSANGGALSRTAIDLLLRRLAGSPGQPLHRTKDSTDEGVPNRGRLVLQANLASIRNDCTIDKSGCWVAPAAGPCACRANGDGRADEDLPKLAPHRWVWMVVHGHSSDPLPAEFQVRRRCGNGRCCRPDHLYLTNPKGEELTPKQVETMLRPQLSTSQDSARVRVSDQHSKLPGNNKFMSVGPTTADLFATRLNTLFEKSSRPDGGPYTSGDVAAALQEEGLPLSESLIEGFRSGSGEVPTIQMIEALAYFFNVDSDYLSGRAHSGPVSGIAAIHLEEDTRHDFVDELGNAQVQVVRMSLIDLGSMVAGFSESISDCISRSPADLETAGSLLALLRDLIPQVSISDREVIIARQTLRQLLREWNAAPLHSQHRATIDRLSRLAENG